MTDNPLPSLVVRGGGHALALRHKSHNLGQSHLNGLDGLRYFPTFRRHFPARSFAVKVDPAYKEGHALVHPVLVFLQQGLDAEETR